MFTWEEDALLVWSSLPVWMLSWMWDTQWKHHFFAYVRAGTAISVSHKQVPTSGLEKQLFCEQIFNHLYIIEHFYREEQENPLPRMSWILLLSLASRKRGTWTKIWTRQDLYPNGFCLASVLIINHRLMEKGECKMRGALLSHFKQRNDHRI